MNSRRDFFKFAGMAGGAVAAASVSKVAMAALPEPVIQTSPDTMDPLTPNTGRPYNPVVTLNGWTLPWRMNNGVKEFHLVAEPVVREMAPGMVAHLWGYNGQSPGPTIEVVEGDRVRIFVTNKLPEHTSVHWHGQRLPNGMDGVAGLNQPAIPSGKTFVYEFEAKRPGTFMYHPHADEMVQMAMGMMGFWVTHPKNKHPLIDNVDRDFCFLLNAYDIDPGAYTPKIMTMLDFNLWTWNSRVFPGISPLCVRKNDKVRIRIGNLTMTNHPIHLHGHEFEVSGTDGGPTNAPSVGFLSMSGLPREAMNLRPLSKRQYFFSCMEWKCANCALMHYEQFFHYCRRSLQPVGQGTLPFPDAQCMGFVRFQGIG